MTITQPQCKSFALWVRPGAVCTEYRTGVPAWRGVGGCDMRAFLTWLTALLLSGTLAGASPDASFSRKPSVSRVSGKTVVSFAVSASTDVEVSVLDAKGVVLRHLAAGLLGGVQAPPEPLKAGLSQSVEWDGLDDFGKAAPGGPFRIRVRAGTGMKFGRFIGDD